MLYHYLKLIARIALRIFCRKIIINKPRLLAEKGPLLLACNHPNSFLDSVILNTIFDQQVWSLARGDVFKKPFHRRMLNKLRIMPVYRTSEGVENLGENYKTFEDCINLFRNNQIITIYSEGKCINEWHLRPLKKGTARLAIKAWDEQLPLRVLPVGLNYSSFSRFGKNVFINFGEIIDSNAINGLDTDGQRNIEFNNRLRAELNKLVYEIPPDNLQLQKEKLTVEIPFLLKIFLWVPAMAGWLINVPLFLYARNTAIRKLKEPGHYDSVVIGILLLTYPVYLLILTAILILVSESLWSLLMIPGALFGAWSWVMIKKQF